MEGRFCGHNFGAFWDLELSKASHHRYERYTIIRTCIHSVIYREVRRHYTDMSACTVPLEH